MSELSQSMANLTVPKHSPQKPSENSPFGRPTALFGNPNIISNKEKGDGTDTPLDSDSYANGSVFGNEKNQQSSKKR